MGVGALTLPEKQFSDGPREGAEGPGGEGSRALLDECLFAPMDERKFSPAFYYLLQKYITKNENSLFIDKKRTNYCSIMDQHLVWYPLASMTAAILHGMDS